MAKMHYAVNAELTHLDHVGQRPPAGTRVIRVALSSDTSHIITCAPDVVLDYRATAVGMTILADGETVRTYRQWLYTERLPYNDRL